MSDADLTTARRDAAVGGEDEAAAYAQGQIRRGARPCFVYPALVASIAGSIYPTQVARDTAMSVAVAQEIVDLAFSGKDQQAALTAEYGVGRLGSLGLVVSFMRPNHGIDFSLGGKS